MHNNYTVTSSSIIANAGDQVNLTTPSVVLTITADAGYTVTFTDFVIGDALPSEVLSAVFSQNGSTVECLLTFDDSFIMPAAEVNLAIDIDGTAVANVYSVAGTYEIVTDNTNQTSSAAIAYSGSGNIGDELTLFTLTFTGDTNNVFLTDPSYLVYLTNAFPENYTVTRVDTLNANNELTEVEYTVKYTLTAAIVTGDKIKFTANAEAVLDPTVGPYYSSYIFRNFEGPSDQNLAGDYFMNLDASSHILQIFGDVGASITITMESDAGGGPVVLFNAVAIDNPVGYRKFEIPFPEVLVDTIYTITLSGDINPVFIQPNPITVYAGVGNSWTLTHNPLAGYTVVESGQLEVSGFGVIDYDEQINYAFLAKFEITKDDGSKIKMLRTPSWDDISNTDPALNGGFVITHGPNLSVTGDGSTTITIEVVGAVIAFGEIDAVSYLSLTNLFNINPVAVDDSANVSKGGVVSIDILANDYDPDGGTLRAPFISVEPLHGTAVLKPDNKIKYTHDGTENYTDSFEYIVSDGYIYSDPATVSIGVGIAAGDSTQISSSDGIFYIPVVVGDVGGEFTVHFDAGDTPDRIELMYEDVVVADALFVGNNLTDGGRAAAIVDVEAVTSLNSFTYVGANGNGAAYGKTAAWNLVSIGDAITFTEAADIATTGNVRGVTSNFGNQFGVGDLVYTSGIDTVGVTGLDSAAGNVSLNYTKALGGSSIVTIKITGISGSIWSVYQTSMV